MTGDRKADLICWLQQNKLLTESSLAPLSGDAGFRNYYRFIYAGQQNIAVDADPNQEKNHEFFNIATAYGQAGILVPEIKAADLDNGFFCLQDFGSILLADKLTLDNLPELYAQALSILPRLQQVRVTAVGELPAYDEALIHRDFDLFCHWLLGRYLKLDIDQHKQSVLTRTYQVLRDNFFQQPQVGVHRDFHSRNLMLVNDDIGVIDFQDAAVGPLTYDAVSLLRDCYLSWPEEQVQLVLKEWHGQYYAEYDWAQFKLWFDLTGIQRHLKAAGIFTRLYLRDNKQAYLQDIPRTLDYVIQVAVSYPELQELGQWLEQEIKPKLLRLLDECD